MRSEGTTVVGVGVAVARGTVVSVGVTVAGGAVVSVGVAVTEGDEEPHFFKMRGR
jgi:hypothetical protein